MRLFDAATTRKFLPWPALIGALREMFRVGCTTPLRQHHEIEVPGEPVGTLLLMPAWVPGDVLGVKVVGVMPGNAARGLPSVMSNYLLSDARTGELLALIDGAELTSRRTAAASALAASHLARSDASTLLIVGTGQLATRMAAAHAAVRPLRDVEVWGRRASQAEAVAEGIRRELGIAAAAVTDLATTPGTKIKLIDHAEAVDAMNKKYGPLYVKATIAPSAYHGMDKPVENIDVWNILVTSDKMSDKMAYDIVKTLMEKKPELVAVHKEAQNIDLKYQKSGSPIPYHPGAKKYFEEQGVKF